MTADIVTQLRGIVGDGHVLVDPDARAGFEVDWTRRFGGPSLAVVRPATTVEVADIVRLCSAERIGLIPQGGNTGLVGGAVPGASHRVIIMSLSRLNTVREIDTAAGQATVDAGVTLEALERALIGSGWDFGVDLAARSSATIGGMVATNAGGTRVLRYGSMRANVIGVEAVLGNGEVIARLDGLVKDNTGLDLAALLCGSEGTLGVVTAVRVRLVPAWRDRLAAAVRCEGWDDAVGLASQLRRHVDGLDGLEAIDAVCARNAADALGVRLPLQDAPVTLFAVWAGNGEPPTALVELLSERDHRVGDPRTMMEARERQAEAIARVGVPHKFDVTLPLAALGRFAREVEAVVPGDAHLFLFGHLGDGNLHVNVVGPAPDDHRVDDAVLGLVARMNGSVSAEHGIGRAKVAYLGLSRSPAEIAAMRSIKSALDPSGVMNPGVLLTE